MYAPVLASSPLSVRNSTGNSFKRTVSRGAGACSIPRPSSLVGSLLQNAESPAQLFNNLSSLSGSATTTSKRDVSSSPTDGSISAAQERSNPASRCVGFDVAPAPCPTIETPFQHSRVATRGLLSRALGGFASEPSDICRVASLAEAGRQGSGQYFPEVDTGLLKDLQERHDIFHSELVVTAYMLAAKAHAGQLRKDGTSQLSHCVMTALHLANLGLDAETVAAGLLHEALRYTPVFRSQMEEFMPSSVVQLVERVTTISEISHLYRNNRDALGEEKMRRMLLAMEDVKAVLVKLACRVHNMKTLSALPRDKQITFAKETLDIFAVVANRLGIWSLKAELEDLAFAVLHPEEYEKLKAQVAERQNPVFLEATINKIKASLDAKGVKYEDISGRPKNLYGIWTKMQSSGHTNLDKVFDVVALRCVVTNKPDCYVALRCVQEAYRTMPERSKDYIKECKKPNGYQSLHETIYGEGMLPVEVQIRTHKMHYIAEYGFAAHWKYKEKLSNEDEWLDKEVQYKKWLTTYKLSVHDNKVRAPGAPRHETALNSLGMHLLDGSPGGRGAEMPGVDPFLKHDRFRLQAPLKQHVAVVVQTQDSIDSREFPVECTAADLAKQLRVDQLTGYVMTINQKLPSPGYVLKNGDLVQVVPEVMGTATRQHSFLSHRSSVPQPDSSRLETEKATTAATQQPQKRPPVAAAASPSFSFCVLPQAERSGNSVVLFPGGAPPVIVMGGQDLKKLDQDFNDTFMAPSQTTYNRSSAPVTVSRRSRLSADLPRQSLAVQIGA